MKWKVDILISPNGEIVSVAYAGCFPPYLRRLRFPLSAMHAAKDDWRDQGRIHSGRQAAWERNVIANVEQTPGTLCQIT